MTTTNSNEQRSQLDDMRNQRNIMRNVLRHLAEVCRRNEDGSLNLGTWEVEMIESALAELNRKDQRT